MPTSATGDEFDERAALAKIADEIEQEGVDRGLWLKALMEAQGDASKQAFLYAKLRLGDEVALHARALARRQLEEKGRQQS